MEKIKIANRIQGYPMAIVLVGTLVGGKPTFTTAGWAVSADPNPYIGTMVLKTHRVAEGILTSKIFSVNIPGVELMNRTDCCGILSKCNVDKSESFEVFYGELKSAPMIEECPVCLECGLVATNELRLHQMFYGEVVQTYSEERYLTGGRLDAMKATPFALTVRGADGNYRLCGRSTGKAWVAVAG